MNWYVIRTKPQQERVAAFHLAQLPVETYLPLLKHMKRIRHIEKLVLEPLFPRYLFAKFDIKPGYRAVSFSKGVHKIVEFGSKPAEVSDALIDGIKSRMSDGYIALEKERFKQGQVVQIAGGPLSGLEAVFVKELKDQDRVLLLLRMLGQHAKLTTDIGNVRQAHAL
jgi:transcriptional antiterminator RfaH